MNIEKYSPFKDVFIEHDDFSEDHSRPDVIKGLENNPDKIIRLEKFSKKQIKSNNFNDLESRVENHKKGKRLFFELKEKYGISVPEFNFVVGEGNDSSPMMYTVVDKVKGKHFIEALPEFRDEGKIEIIENHFIKIINYLRDKHKEQGEWLCDIVSNKQYMYGKTSNNQEDDLYLVDVQPLFLNFDKKSSRNYFYELLTEKIVEEISEAESSLGTDLPLCREQLLVFLREVSLAEPNNKDVEEALKNIS